MQQLAIGTELQGGKYKILKVLGQGGFGITYLAEQIMLNREVAIKEFFFKECCERDDDTNQITLGISNAKEMVNRFKTKFIKEAKTIAALNHPNIIKIYDIFVENNTAYYVMEYIEGKSLEQMVKISGPMPELHAIKYVKQVADALQYIHARNINHLDIKPSNIMVADCDDDVHVIDFGLSKQYDADGGQTSTTPVGISHGYAPLEQYRPGGVSVFCPATDVYSLGATLFKLITGETPPSASDVVEDGIPDFPAEVSASVSEVIRKSMVVSRKKRLQSVDDFLAILTTEVTGDEVSNLDEVSKIDIMESDEDNSEDLQDEVEETIEETQVLSNESPEETDVINELIKLGVNNPRNLVPVDLGLSVRWASLNLGSNNICQKGDLYGWGDASGKINTEGMYLQNTDVPMDISNTKFDIASIKLGKHWGIPSILEWKELHEKCNWEWYKLDLINGYIVTGVNGNKIFLPTAGRRYGTVAFVNEWGYYWSSNKSLRNESFAKFILFSEKSFDDSGEYNYFIGRSIRPVYK